MKETLSNGQRYFFVNNEIFKKEVSANAKIVYMYLCKCADCFGKSWPSHKRIASACSLGITTVKIALKELQEAKIITVSHRYREEGGKSSNMYMIMDRSPNKAFYCNAAIFNTTISAKAKLIYLYFCRCANKEGTCYPAHRTTAAACLVSVGTVRNAIKELIEVKLLGAINRYRENNGQTSNLYTILSPVIDVVAAVIEKASAMLKEENQKSEKMGHDPKKKEPRTPWAACIQSLFSRGLRHYLAGDLPKDGYERTISKLRAIHIKGL